MRYYDSLILTLIFICGIFKDTSGVVKFKRSTDKNLRDPGTYIVHFKDNTTDSQQHHFAEQLNRRSNRRPKFEAKIIAEYPNIKCLTTKLSEKALKWVSISSCIVPPTKHTYSWHHIICLLHS